MTTPMPPILELFKEAKGKIDDAIDLLKTIRAQAEEIRHGVPGDTMEGRDRRSELIEFNRAAKKLIGRLQDLLKKEGKYFRGLEEFRLRDFESWDQSGEDWPEDLRMDERRGK